MAVQSRERVIEVIKGGVPDRIPVYGWVRANLDKQITEAFGSADAFEDKYAFDFAHLFGGPSTWVGDALRAAWAERPGGLEPADVLELPMSDPRDTDAYANIVEQVRHHKEARGRFVYVQTPGIFEALNGVFGIQNHLMHLMVYPEDLERVYRRQAEWNRDFAMTCLDLGVDMVHVSDDWGAQDNLMFSTQTWWDLIYPAHRITAEAVKDRGAWLSLHSDGNVTAVIDGIIKLGYDVVHPWQVSAGMSYTTYRERCVDAFALMGGLDVQTTIGFGRHDELVANIEEVLGQFTDGHLLYCTSHFVQDHCTIEELTLAFDTIYRVVRELARG